MITPEMIKKIHDNAVEKGFWDPTPTFGETCALIHSELSEALEEYRRGNPAEYTGENGKPEGIWTELADAVIRIADWMGYTEVILDPNEGYTELHDVLMDFPLIKASFGDFIALAHWMLSGAYSAEDMVSTYATMMNLVYHIYARAEVEGIDFDGIIERKHAYNVTRSYRHGGKKL